MGLKNRLQETRMKPRAYEPELAIAMKQPKLREN